MISENTSKITCPSCGHSFNAEQAFAHEVEEKLKREFNQKFQFIKADLVKKSEEKELELKKSIQEKELELKKKSEEQEIILKKKAEERELAFNKKMQEDRANLEAELRKKVMQDVELQLKNSEEELAAKRKEVNELKSKELLLLKKEQEMIERGQEMELQLQRKLIEERKSIEEQAKRKSDEENQLRIKEKDMKLEQMMEQMEIMKKKAEQGSMQLQGEVQELILEEMLKTSFPFDNISEVGKGVKGADVIQTVRNNLGNVCGVLIYESKRTKSFSNEWIEKLKQDLRGQKADLAIIVTETMPKDMDKFGQKDGIWICTFAEVKGVATILRETLIKIHDIKASSENKGDKMQLIYDYLAGNEFKLHIEAFMDTFKTMNENLFKEKAQAQRYWNEREKQLDKMLLNMTGMYGSIKGIMGNSVAEVKYLQNEDKLID